MFTEHNDYVYYAYNINVKRGVHFAYISYIIAQLKSNEKDNIYNYTCVVVAHLTLNTPALCSDGMFCY